MSDSPPMALAMAQHIATTIQNLLAPACTRLVVAGAIRRERPLVEEIKFVIEPRYTITEEQVTPTETATLQVCELERQVLALHAIGVLQPRYKPSGVLVAWPTQFTSTSRYLAAWYCPNDQDRYLLDLFIMRPDRLNWWGWHLLLHTGPDDCNQMLLLGPDMRRQVDNPVGTKSILIHGLLPAGLIINGPGYEGTVRRLGGIPLPLPTESAVFETWRMLWVEPQQRTPIMYHAARAAWLDEHRSH